MRKKLKQDVERYLNLNKEQKLPWLLAKSQSTVTVDDGKISHEQISIHDQARYGQSQKDLKAGVKSCSNEANHKRYTKKNHQSMDLDSQQVALSKQFETNFSFKSQSDAHALTNDPIKLGDNAKRRRKALMELLQQQKKKPKKFGLKVPEEGSYARLTLKNKIKCVRKDAFDEIKISLDKRDRQGTIS